MMKKEIELLAPAGSLDSFYAACNGGADAIYMGVEKFNARVMAKNVTMEEYKSAISYAHVLGAKVYLTLNTLLYEEELEDAVQIVLELYANGLDAVIVQDMGLASLLHKLVPKLALHASTQMSVYSLEQVKQLEKIGFTRVVLARELTIPEIKEICQNTTLEVEVFVHGALCVSVSGQCLLSATNGQRSANRGNCAQPCRMRYRLYNEEGKQITGKAYLLSKKDIFGISFLEQLASVGVHSFKLEGRNKNPEYVYCVTKKYHTVLEQIRENQVVTISEKDKKELLQMFNRSGESAGYLNGVTYKESITQTSPKNTGLVLGTVLAQKTSYIKVCLEESINLHDGIEIYDGDNVYSTIVTCIRDEEQKLKNHKIEKGQTVWLGDIAKKMSRGSIIYKTSSKELIDISRMSCQKEKMRRKKYDIDIRIQIGKPLEAVISLNEEQKHVYTSYLPVSAKTTPLTQESVKKAFESTQDTAIEFHMEKIELDSNVFVPVSEINALRREVVQFIISYQTPLPLSEQETKEIKNTLKDMLSIAKKEIPKKSKFSNPLAILQYQREKNYFAQEFYDRIDILYYDYKENREWIKEKEITKTHVFIVLPNFILEKGRKYLIENLEKLIQDGITGFVLDNLQFLEPLLLLKKQYHITLIAGSGCNITNSMSANYYTNLGFDILTLSIELELEQALKINQEYACEWIRGYHFVLTSRYCILGSFVANLEQGKSCFRPCMSNSYYLIDEKEARIPILCDNIDCITRLARPVKTKRTENTQIVTKKCILT